MHVSVFLSLWQQNINYLLDRLDVGRRWRHAATVIISIYRWQNGRFLGGFKIHTCEHKVVGSAAWLKWTHANWKCSQYHLTFTVRGKGDAIIYSMVNSNDIMTLTTKGAFLIKILFSVFVSLWDLPWRYVTLLSSRDKRSSPPIALERCSS